MSQGYHFTFPKDVANALLYIPVLTQFFFSAKNTVNPNSSVREILDAYCIIFLFSCISDMPLLQMSCTFGSFATHL